MKEGIGIIILAAGASRRMGRPKQLLSIEGQSLIRRVVNTALATTYRPVILVLGANEEIVRSELLDLPLEIVFNKDWSKGMASSLVVGLKRLLILNPNATSSFVLLGDQPFIKEEIIYEIVRRYKASDKKIVAASYKGSIGVPAIFDQLFFDKILQLKGEQGAKKIITTNMGQVESIDIPEAALDIDTPEDLQKMRERWKKNN